MTTLSPISPAVKSDRLANFAIGIDRYRRAPKGGCVAGGKFYAGGQFIGNLAVEVEEAQPEPAPVVVGIHGFTYVVEGIAIPAEIGTHAFEMHKRGTSTSYFLVRDNYGEVRCDCPSFEFRKAGTGEPCKHGKKLIEMGLIPSPTPRCLPPFKHRAEVTTPAKPARPRRFVPTPEDCREAAMMFAR